MFSFALPIILEFKNNKILTSKEIENNSKSNFEKVLDGEALQKSSQGEANNLGIIGKLVPNSFHRSTDGMTAYFSITNEESLETLPVSYSGEIGEIFFNQNAEIIIRGSMQSDGLFKTQELSIKCPSKYVDNYEDEKEL